MQLCLECSEGNVRGLLLRQFHGCVIKLMQSPNGNYVLTKAFCSPNSLPSSPNTIRLPSSPNTIP